MAQAKAADDDLEAGLYRGPLHGIPWGAKDLLAVKGYPTTWGAGGLEQQTFKEDATVVERLDAAGAVLVAKFSLGTLAMGDKWLAGVRGIRGIQRWARGVVGGLGERSGRGVCGLSGAGRAPAEPRVPLAGTATRALRAGGVGASRRRRVGWVGGRRRVGGRAGVDGRRRVDGRRLVGGRAAVWTTGAWLVGGRAGVDRRRLVGGRAGVDRRRVVRGRAAVWTTGAGSSTGPGGPAGAGAPARARGEGTRGVCSLDRRSGGGVNKPPSIRALSRGRRASQRLRPPRMPGRPSP